MSASAGWKDWNVARYARDGDFILVTNNASDFRQLYAAEPLHAGLVILIPVVGRVMQQRLFKAALDELAVIGEPVNRVLEVDLDGEEVTLTLYDLPPPAHHNQRRRGRLAPHLIRRQPEIIRHRMQRVLPSS